MLSGACAVGPLVPAGPEPGPAPRPDALAPGCAPFQPIAAGTLRRAL